MKKKHLLLVFIVVLFDQLSKIIVDSNMNLGQKIPLIPGFFNFTYVQNTGAAWSMLEGKQVFFYIISIVALVMMFLFYRNSETQDRWTRFGLTLMMAGTIGNFIDRLLFQHVRDFIDFVIFGYDFPVFNIADMALCIGVVIIIADVFLESIGVYHK